LSALLKSIVRYDPRRAIGFVQASASVAAVTDFIAADLKGPAKSADCIDVSLRAGVRGGAIAPDRQRAGARFFRGGGRP
jgi:hypothetical protein